MTKVLRDLSEIFKTYGFSIAEGPEVEKNEYCFDRLNIPKNHPARDEADTFYIKGDFCLRTHTSSVQVRTMLSQKPPIKIIAPGRVYRKDDFDATHSPVFHQIEGLYISKDVSFADLRSLLINVLKDYFGEHIDVSFQPSFSLLPSHQLKYIFHALNVEAKTQRIVLCVKVLEILKCLDVEWFIPMSSKSVI